MITVSLFALKTANEQVKDSDKQLLEQKFGEMQSKLLAIKNKVL
jgi:hypothetical protein